MKDLFDKTDNQPIVDFIKDINFYHSLLHCLLIFILAQSLGYISHFKIAR